MEKGNVMADPVYRKSEFVGTSTSSFHEAAANAVAKASQVFRNISWFEVIEQRGSVVEDKIQQFQVTIQVGHRVD